MINLNTLDTLISIIVVLLGLSLVVQAIQAGLKKLFKIKSRQLEESLVDLFENVLGSKKKEVLQRFRSPTLRLLTKHPVENASEDAQKVFRAVIKEFQGIGRVATSGRRMFDSISKEDLIKVLRRVGPDSLLPKFSEQFERACTQANNLDKAIESVFQQAEHLSGGASAKFAKVQEALTPLMNDMRYFFKEDKSFNKDLLLADVLNLREVKISEALDLLAEVQKNVKSDLIEARKEAIETAKLAALEALERGLKNIAVALTNLRREFDAAIVPLRVRLDEVESWYDTVMQSFEERYARGMKTYAFVISLGVAVWLNANIFGIYRDVAVNADRRASLVQSGEQTLQRYREQLAAPEVINNPAAEQKLSQMIQSIRAEIDGRASEHTRFGFTPLGADFATLANSAGAWNFIRQLFYMIFGWLIMASLLSIGAPFWHDTLESLFGIKNLLRKKGDIKNVEKEAGAGQP